MEKHLKTLIIDGRDVMYLKIGHGPHTVILMPGTLGSFMYSFKKQFEGFDLDKFTVVSWDPPGYGQSKPHVKKITENFYDEYAYYAYKLLVALEIPKVSLLGWCGGGRASLILAGKYPELVNKLVIWGASSFISQEDFDNFNKYKDIVDWSARVKDPMVHVYGAEELQKLWSTWIGVISKIFEENNGDVCNKYLKNISCPTLVMFGAEDPLISVNHADYFKENIKDCRVHVYPKGRHDLHERGSEEFNQRVQEFLLS